MYRLAFFKSLKRAWLALLFIVAGALVLFGYRRDRRDDFLPVEAAYPAEGIRISEAFRLSRGGKFVIQVVTPNKQNETGLLRREQPDIECTLDLLIVGPQRFHVNRTILRLRNGGWTSSHNLFLDEKEIVFPRAGEYRLLLSSRAPVELFSRPGVLVQLTRFETVGPDLLGLVSRSVGYALVGLGLLCFFFLHRRSAL